MSTSMSTTSKPWLPVEIYDEIISLVTSTKDLLNLSLTCQTLCKLIIPNHIDYRNIVCSTFDSLVWEHFLNNPHLAKGIYSIKVLDNAEFQDVTGTDAKRERRIIPRELRTLSTRKLKRVSQPKAFVGSFSVMKNLYSFGYRGPCPAFLLFTHLAHCATGLRVFKYNYSWSPPDEYSKLLNIIGDPESQISKGFECLKCCSLNIRFQDKYDNQVNILSMVNDLLENNHSLKSVTLFVWDTPFNVITIPKFLSRANWSKIHTLTLGGDLTSYEDDIDPQLRISQKQSFFSRHALLEKFRIRDSWNTLIYPGTLQPDMLPNLHTLDLDFRMPYPVSELIPENLIHRLANLSASLSKVPDSFITFGHLRNIRRLYTEVNTYNRIPILLEGIPNIERLHIVMHHVDLSTEGEPGVLPLLPYFVKHNKNLTHLSLSLWFRAEASSPENYARELDKLEFIHFSRTNTVFNPWFRVIRPSLGTVSLTRHLEDSDEWALRSWMGIDSSSE